MSEERKRLWRRVFREADLPEPSNAWLDAIAVMDRAGQIDPYGAVIVLTMPPLDLRHALPS